MSPPVGAEGIFPGELGKRRRDCSTRDYGSSPPALPDPRGSVPPRIDHDFGRETAVVEFPEGVIGRDRLLPIRFWWGEAPELPKGSRRETDVSGQIEI